MKKWLALCMAICLVVMLFSTTHEKVHAANIEQEQSQPFKDLTKHWAESAVKHMSALALMNGYENGDFKPDLNMSRAEFVTVLDRAFGFTGRNSTSFEDMDSNAWYYDAMMRANGSGILLGTSATHLSPADPVTREDAAVMIDRAFQLSTELDNDAVLLKYDDYSDIADYSKKALSYLVNENIMKGYNGKLQPKSLITRAETAMLLSAMIADVISSPKTYTSSSVEGNVIVRSSEVSLRNIVISGNLLLAEGIAEGDINLESVNITGSVIIKGGGSHSVDISNSIVNRIVVDKHNGPVKVAIHNTSRVEKLLLLDQAIVELSHDSSIDTLQVDPEAHKAVIQAEGSIKELIVDANNVIVNNEEVGSGLRTFIQAKEQNDNKDNQGSNEDIVNPSQPSKPHSEKPIPATTIPDHQWKLVWNDEFNGSEIDSSKWTIADTGLVYNNELQYYSPNNTRIIKENNRSVLQIEAKKGGDGGKEYSSGKLITMGKGDWTYGKVVVRAKLPVDQGIWPAIWMMPTDEAHYGGWPASGEIDIMELIGGEQNKNRVYSTLHFDSEQPDGSHGHVQGSFTLPDGQSFSDDYHDFQVEWLPGVIRFYVDGKLHHEVKDWQTKASGQPEYYTYPAPFDRPFYLILNVAVGGDWPGSPNDEFQSDTMEVDFVRVYSYKDLDSWPDVTGNPPKPEKQREPQEDGNQLYNSTFAESNTADGIPDQWQFIMNANGSGTVEIVDDVQKGKAAKVTINNAGTENYSIQLTQMPIYVEKHKRYKVVFDAKASAERTMISKVTQFENNWTNYSGDQVFELTTDWQSYEYSFNMNTSSDNNARFEFNLGLNDETVMFANVRLIELGEAEPNPEFSGDRPALSDGNLIYNGTFDQGKDRLAFWKNSITSEAIAKVSVNNFLQFPIMERQLAVEVSKTNGDPSAIVVSQPDLLLKSNTTYGLYYDAKADASRGIAINAVSTSDNLIHIAHGRTVQLSTEMQTYVGEIVVGDGDLDVQSALQFLLGESTGTVYIDNVRLVKRGNPVLVNGYAHVPATQAWLMQGLQLEDSSEGGKNVAYMNEGDLLQYKVEVARDANYTLSARLASNEDRSAVGFTIKDDTGNIVTQSEINLGNTGGWQTYKTIDFAPVHLESGRNYYVEFTGVDYNTLWIELSDGLSNRDLIMNGDFSSGAEGWTSYAAGDQSQLKIEIIDHKLQATIGNAGDNPWDRQVIYEGIAMQKGSQYTISFKAKADDARKLGIGIGWVDAANNYEWHGYFEQQVELTTEEQMFTYTFEAKEDSYANARISFDMGNMLGENDSDTSITLSDVSLVNKF